jgi:hypothetical protein
VESSLRGLRSSLRDSGPFVSSLVGSGDKNSLHDR